MKVLIDGQQVNISKRDYELMTALNKCGVRFTLKKPKKERGLVQKVN